MARRRKIFEALSSKAFRKPTDFYLVFAIITISVIDLLLYIRNHPADLDSIRMIFFIPDFSQIGTARSSVGFEGFAYPVVEHST